jgi:anaerobic selenocysteine-containing dehydrogenase
MSRRAALGALAGAAGLAGCRRGWMPPEDDPTSRAVAKPHVPGAERYGTHEERWFQSSCGQCPASCGIRVRVVEGRAVRVEGNRAHPLNEGGIGPRGLASLQGLYDADRITGPLARVDGALVPISWADALDRLAGELAALRGRGEPERLLVWSGLERGLMHELLARFAAAYGTPNFVDGRPGHSGVLAQAMEATVGVAEVPVWGWQEARTILSVETGLLDGACQSVHFTRMAAMRRRGSLDRARIVHLGPMLDLTAYDADEWIRIRPGTGGAVALGLAGLLLAGHPDEAALPADLVDGAAGFRALAAGFTPARVEALSGVAPRVLERLAADLWDERPSLAIVDERSLAYSNGLDTARAVLGLDAVLGGFWAEAAAVRAAAAAPLRDWPPVATDAIAAAGLARPRLDGAAAFARARAVHETLPEAIEAGPAPAIALLHHANPAWARQQPARWRRALARIPLIVSFSPYRDDTVEELAHLVLPDHTFLERWEIATPAPALDRAIATARVPVIEPLHDTRPSGDVVVELAARLGEPLAAALPWRTFREASEARVTPEMLRALETDGFWIEPARPPAVPPRVTLHAAWSPPVWYGDAARYPLELVVYQPAGYAEGSGANLPWLRTLRPGPRARPWSFTARVHPSSAPGLRDGEEIVLESEWGTIAITAQLDERIEPGCVAVPAGGGHRGFGRWAAGFGSNVMELVRPGPATDSGADLRCATRVRIVQGGRS